MKNSVHATVNAQPRFHQRAGEIQAYGTVLHLLPLELEEPVRLEMTSRLNQLLADTISIRDLYKKSHWQVAGPTFYQLHLLLTSTLKRKWSWWMQLPREFSYWEESVWRWQLTWRKPLRSPGRRAAEKKFGYSFHACSTRTRSSFATRGSSPAELPS